MDMHLGQVHCPVPYVLDSALELGQQHLENEPLDCSASAVVGCIALTYMFQHQLHQLLC